MGKQGCVAKSKVARLVPLGGGVCRLDAIITALPMATWEGNHNKRGRGETDYTIVSLGPVGCLYIYMYMYTHTHTTHTHTHTYIYIYIYMYIYIYIYIYIHTHTHTFMLTASSACHFLQGPAAGHELKAMGIYIY